MASEAAANPKVEVDFRHVDIIFGPKPEQALTLLDQGAGPPGDPRADRPRDRRRRRHGRDRAGRDLRPDGALGLGQVDPAALHQRPQQGDPRRDPGRRCQRSGRRHQVRSGDPPAPAHPADRHGLPAVRAAALAHGRRERRLRPGIARHGPGRARPRGRGQAQDGQPRPVAGQVRPRALGRHAAKGRARARVRDRCRHPAHGRAVLRPRSPDPQPPPGRAPGAAAHASRRPSSSSATTSTRR